MSNSLKMEKRLTDLPEGLNLRWFPDWIQMEECQSYFANLLEEVGWRQETIKLFGKTFWQPRLLAWQGTQDYSYSGKKYLAHPFSPTVIGVKERLDQELGLEFNGVLINRYRDGLDSMGWHSDDEKELGVHPVIASVSLGAQRKMRFRNKANHSLTYDLFLPAGSLLIMEGQTQQLWQHALPKSKRVSDERINLTFRQI